MAVRDYTCTPQPDMINRDLKMQYSKNLEVGLDFEMFGIKGGVTYYNEKMRNVIPFV